jgi:hypothetical protein
MYSGNTLATRLPRCARNDMVFNVAWVGGTTKQSRSQCINAIAIRRECLGLVITLGVIESLCNLIGINEIRIDHDNEKTDTPTTYNANRLLYGPKCRKGAGS